jgi:hypothetical protein
MPKFKIEVEVSDQFILDVMCTMVESSYDWFTFRNVVRNEALDILSFEVADTEAYNEYDGHDDGFPWETVTPMSVAHTINQFFEIKPVNDMFMGYLASAVATDDAGDVDANLADDLLQWTVFDKIIYA